MTELLVRHPAGTLALSEGESLGFGRTSITSAAVKGWGYGGRFLELDAAPHLHRIWGEVVFRAGLWVIRSLGTRDPVVVVAPGPSRVDLPPRRVGSAPAEFAMTDGSAMILLTSGGSSFSLGCSSGSVPTDWADRSPRFGDATTTLGAMLADSIGEQEFRVLWVMSREYRSGETADPAPLSYPRVVRALGLSTEKQASSAAARLKRRFADACLMPDQVEPDLQRAWMCRFAVQHHLFDPLIERYGDPPAD